MRRLFWMGVGVVSTLWTQRRLKEKMDEITPANVGREAVRTARRASGEAVQRVGSAIAEGRQAARFEEDRLRHDLAVRPRR